MASIDYDGIKNNKYTYGSKKMIKINGSWYYIQCPKKIDANTTFYIAGRGSGGIGDVNMTFKAAKGKNVIVIAPVHTDMKDFTRTIDIIDNLANHYNIGGTPQVTISGHSLSGTHAMTTAITYIKKYNTPTAIVLNDPYNYGSDNLDYSAFKGSFILDYGPKSGGCTDGYMTRLKKAAKAGAKVIICRYNNDHGAADEVAAGMGTYDMANLQLVDRNTFKKYNGVDTKGVYTYQYLDSKGKLHNFKNAEEAQEYMDEALAEITGSLYSKCDNLADFSSKYKGSTGTVASNMVFVNNCMSDLKGHIKAHNDINYTKGSDNEASVVGAMYSATNYYGAVTNILYGNISAEADAVYAIANAIYKMDGFAAVLAETSLTNGVSSLFNTSNLSSELNELNRASSELVNTAKTAAMAGGRYDALTTLLGNPVAEGSVGKVSISSLEAAVNAVVPSLNDEVDKARGMKASVDEFMTGIGSSNILQGGVWDNVKTNMESYQNLLDCNMKAAEFLSDTIKTAMGIIVDYMGTETELDDSKLPELRKQLEELNQKIEEMNAELTKMKSCTKPGETHTTTDPETGDPKTYTDPDVPCYTDSEISTYSSQITIKETQRKELEEDIKKLEGLAPIVQAAQELINNAVSQVKSMYENPVKDANGNESFVANFKLDLSPYSSYIDINKDYKKIIDDYYDKLNPKPVEPPAEETPRDEDPGDEDPGYRYGTPPPATPEPKTEPKTETPTEAPTEAPTETSTEEVTEAPTEEPTETPTEEPTGVPTEAPTETPTVAPTEAPASKPPKKKHKGGGSEKKPGIETKPTEPEMVETEPITEIETIPEETIIEDPTDFDEEFYSEPEIIELDEAEEIIPTPSKKNNGSRIMGIASGVGLVVGAAALGAHTILKNKDKEEDESEYGYDK